MRMPINFTFMQVKVKTWIKIAEPTLILVLIEEGFFPLQFPTI